MTKVEWLILGHKMSASELQSIPRPDTATLQIAASEAFQIEVDTTVGTSLGSPLQSPSFAGSSGVQPPRDPKASGSGLALRTSSERRADHFSR